MIQLQMWFQREVHIKYQISDQANKVTAVCLVSSPERLRLLFCLVSLDDTELSAGLIVSPIGVSVSVSPAVSVWHSVRLVRVRLQTLPQLHQQLFAITRWQVSQVVLRGQLHQHLRVDIGSDADAVIAGDGEFMVEDPAGGVGTGLATQVGREGMQVSHMAVS